MWVCQLTLVKDALLCPTTETPPTAGGLPSYYSISSDACAVSCVPTSLLRRRQPLTLNCLYPHLTATSPTPWHTGSSSHSKGGECTRSLY